MTNNIIQQKIVKGCILAGGLSSRMGTDKAFVKIAKNTMIEQIIYATAPQVKELIINANLQNNINADKYKKLGLNVFPDTIKGSKGPLAGVLCALENLPNCDYVFTTPVDCPLISNNVVKTLLNNLKDDTDIIRASSNGRIHPVIALWRVGLKNHLKSSIVDKKIYKVENFTKNYNIITVDFSSSDDIFFNVNDLQDLQQLKTRQNKINKEN